MSADEPTTRSAPTLEWAVSEGLIDYTFALDAMRRRTSAIREGRARELVWLLEHPPIYTAGTGAKATDLINPARLPVHNSGRGGQFTYHGPGQRVVYVMLDLGARGMSVRGLVTRLESWVIGALAEFNVTGETRPGRVGVWIRRHSPSGTVEEKIAAIGLRVSHWISSHGISLNVDPDLSQYEGIVPCGVREHGVTSLAALGLPVTLYDADIALKRSFQRVFGETRLIEATGVEPAHRCVSSP
jgi:lipoyl(octanoyl) transferase